VAHDHPAQGQFGDDRYQRRDLWVRRAGLFALAVLIAGSFLGVYSQPATALRATGVYLFLMLAFRFAGHRTLAQITNFDMILILIIGETTQNAIIGDDNSLWTAGVAIAALVVLDVLIGRGKQAWPQFDTIADGLPVVVVAQGKPLPDRMNKQGVDLEDVLAAARERHGITKIEDVEYAVLEKSGGISVIPGKNR
jgi:uncharacterized membrane protein YcaP (DUF421 family)